MTMKNYWLISVLMLSGCTGPAVRSIPAGYIGRVLTPTGWEQSTRSAGQVDLRTVDRLSHSIFVNVSGDTYPGAVVPLLDAY